MRMLFPELESKPSPATPCIPTRPAIHGVELPHPIPYQGSKRLLARRILSYTAGRHFRRLYEPFSGSGAITIAAAHARLADEFIIGDSLESLAALWQCILSDPALLADQYEHIWSGFQQQGSIAHYNSVRAAFNQGGDPAQLLYLLARCVKNAPRFNQDGQFNQSPDKRRLGMRPKKMRLEIYGVHSLLRNRARVVAGDFEQTIADATRDDLVYMDPPYEGTSTGTDKRYHQGMDRTRLISTLENLDRRDIPYLLSYDGQSGTKRYGDYLPSHLDAERIELHAGRSSQATLNGRNDVTIESLYVSRSLLPSENAMGDLCFAR